MNMEALCPLPIDWLDWLEGDAEAAPAEHLERCPACRALVEELRGKELSAEPLKTVDRAGLRPWIEHPTESPHEFQIWWTSSVALDGSHRMRALLLLLDDFEEGGSRWVRVAPISTDIESATQSEIRLEREESDLDVPMVVLIGHQTVMRPEGLDSRVGILRETGRRLIAASLEGAAPEHRYGPPFENEYDSRLSAYEEEARLVRVLGRDYEELSWPIAAGSSAREGSQDYEAERLSKSSLRWRSDSSLALAAASSEGSAVLEATLVRGTGSIVGIFESRPLRGGHLVFRIESSTIEYPVVIEVEDLSGVRYSSPVFEPKVGVEVNVAPASVFPKAIKKVELKSSDE